MSMNPNDEKKPYSRKNAIDAAMANAPARNKGATGLIGDTLLSGLSSAVAVPELAVGLLDIPTGGRVGKFLENEGGGLGFRPGEAKEAIGGWKSEQSQEQMREFQETEGFGGKLNYARKNPSMISNTVVESLAPMLAGGVVGRGLGAAAKGLSPVAAGALGEGAVGAGLAAEQIRQQTDDGLLTGKQAGLAAATGATTAGFGFAGGKIAQKLGIGDVDTLLASGSRTVNGNKGMARRIGEGALTEGLLEELPQSVSETILQNEALGRPLDEGVTDAAVLGLLSGATMGGVVGGITRNRTPARDDITPTEDMGQEVPRLGLPNPNAPNGNQLGYQGAISDPNNPNWIEDANPDYFNRGQGPDAGGMRNLNPDPELTYNSELGGQFSATQDGTVFSEAEYNDYLAQQQAQARAARDAGMSDINDVSQVPEGYDKYGSDPRLPAPRSDFEVTPDGTAQTAADVNTSIQNERAANAERLARRLRGEIQDNTPVPDEAMGFGDIEPVDNRKLSERMGLDPNKGSLSAAAAIAVDTGASSVAADFEQASAPTQSPWQSGMMDRLSNADQNNSTYARLAQAMQNEPTSVAEKTRLMREADELPRAEVAARQIKPNTRVLDEARAQTKAYTPEGKEVQAQWDVVDASELVTSNTDSFTINPNFPASRQPRDRTRASAQQQVNDIASKLQPNLLGESPDVSTGAPFVGANDNIVDSGNGRSMAIRRVYQENGEKAQAYRQFVNEQAGKFGLDTNAVNMMQSPVLVRRNTSDMNRDEFARAANKPTAARMSSTEQAASDAKSLPDASLLSFNSEGSMSLHQSQRYLKNFIAALPKTEQGSLMDESGALSREGKSRIEAAIVQDAYNNPRLVSAISEKLDNDTTNVLRAVTDKAPQISQINADIKTGDVYDNTLARDIADATQAYIDLKNTDKNINDYLSQDSLLGDGLTDGAKEILSVLSDNRRSAKAIGEYIQERINQVTGRGNPKQGGLSFDDELETDAPNVLNNEPATQLTDENPTVNIPAPKKAPRELSDKAMVREMQKPAAKNTETDYKAALNLSEGQNLGRLIMSSGRVFDDAVVKSMDDKGVTVEATVNGKRGLHKGMQYQTVDAGINNTKSYAKQQAAATEDSAREQASKDYRLRSVEVQEDLAKRGLSDALYKKAGLKKNNSFENLPIAEQAEAYAKLVEDGTTPTTFNESYNDKVMRKEKEAEARRKERTNPSKAMQPSKSYAQVQLEVADEMGITTNEDGEYDISDAQFDAMEGRVRERMEKDLSEKTIAPKASEMKFSRAAGMSETAELKDLLVVHNITSEGVLAATDLGGLAAPSIAVIRSEVSDFTGYGEITLIADPLFITGKDMPTYDADIYSPRQPRPIFDINEKRFRDFENSLSGTQYNLRAPTTSDLSDGADRLLRSGAVQYEFLKSIGKEPKLKNAKVDSAIKAAAKIDLDRQAAIDNPKFVAVFRNNANQQIEKALAIDKTRKGFEEEPSQEDIDFFSSIYFNEDGSVNQDQFSKFVYQVNTHKRNNGKDYNQLQKDLSEKMRSPLIQRRFEKWATEKFNSLVDGKVLFKGFTPGGSRKYAPYNLENVVKEMTGKLNNGENFSYGAGSVRSVYANELKTLKDIQARREKIIPKEDFAKIKEESSQVFSDALESLRPYYKYDADSWNYQDDVANAIAEGAAGVREAFGTNKEAKKIIDDLTYYLSNLPTEYFEAKAQRAVQFNEFDTAIVPKDANPEAVKVLRDAGVKIKRYDQKVEGDKNRLIAQQTKLMFSKPESERANPNTGEKVSGTTNTTRQQVLAKLNDKFGKETIDKLMAAGKLDIKVLSDFVVDGKLTIPSDVDGLYHNGKATLIADNLSDDMIIPTFLHELGGHGGMQSLMDKKAYAALMKDFDALVKAGDPLAMQAKAMADKVARNEQDALDEYLPYLITLASRQQAKQGKVAGMINRMVMAIRSWLKNKLGVPIQINTQDILSLAERMVNEVEKQGSTLDAANAVPQFSDPNIPDKQMQDVRAKYEGTDEWMKTPNGSDTNLTEQQWLQVRTPAFKKWFGDWEGDPDNASKVVDDNGEPMVVYHGTNNDFNSFDTERLSENTDNEGFYGSGFYFTNKDSEAGQYGDLLKQTYLNIRKPLYNSQDDLSQFAEDLGYPEGEYVDITEITEDGYEGAEFTRTLIERGYDGVIANEDMVGDAHEFVAFNSNQIKSATDNAGTFDPNNNDIRYSRAGGMSDQFDPINMARESKQRLYDWASSAPPGKLSWWHKTIGTMYNLAQRNPAFKPVFDNTEKFINDVSFYASKASEFAPRLLPQLDSIRDITKSAIGAKDNEALSKPIFEGTLLWGRDLDGKAVLIEDWRKKVMAASKQDRLQMLKDANRITPAQLQQLATLNNIQANRFINGIIDEEVNAGLVWTDNELRSKFNLDDKQIELYREFRATTDNSLDSMTRSDMLRRLGKDAATIETAVMEAGTLREAVFNIEQHINDLIQASPKKEKSLKNTLKDIKESQFRTNKLIDDGYAPLSRFGQYTVDVVDKDGNREYFGMFESAYEARKMKGEMDALYGDDQDFTVTQGALSKEEFKLFAGVTPETAELFGEMMGLDATGDKAADDAFQEYLRRTKNNRSTMKRLMHRKGIKGYSEDVGRVLASFVYSNARHTSAALNMGNLDRSIQDIPKGEGQLKDAAVKLAEYIKNPQEEGNVIRGWMFAQYLGGSIASAAVNITQPIAVSFPYLSQFGGAVKAASQLKRSSSDWAKSLKNKNNDHFEADLRDAIARAEADGTLSPQEVHNLLKQASGKNPLSAGDGTKIGDAKALASNTLSRVSLAWGSLFSLAEQVNRRVTFVAAYRMAVEQGMDNPAEFATKSIKETQFVYNKASRMNWGRGAVGGTLMTFKTYTVSYMELMHRLWTQGEKGSEERAQGRKAVGIMLGTLFLLGGAGGLPFMEDAEDLVDGIGQIMGYNFSSKKVRQDFLDEWIGEFAGDFIDGGISSVSGSPTDVSGRLGLGNLIPGTGIFKERTSNVRDILEVAGPAGDFVGRIGTGTRDIAKGVANLDTTSLKKGALEFAPTAVRNAVKGVSMATTGIYKDTKGYKVADVSPIDSAFKAIGFQPRDISKIQEANYLGQSSTSYYNLRASNIRALWAAGVNEGNQSKVADARAAVQDWNAKNPNQKIVIKPNDIAKRVREMRMDKSERVIKKAPKSSRGALAEDFAKASQ